MNKIFCVSSEGSSIMFAGISSKPSSWEHLHLLSPSSKIQGVLGKFCLFLYTVTGTKIPTLLIDFLSSFRSSGSKISLGLKGLGEISETLILYKVLVSEKFMLFYIVVILIVISVNTLKLN